VEPITERKRHKF